MPEQSSHCGLAKRLGRGDAFGVSHKILRVIIKLHGEHHIATFTDKEARGIRLAASEKATHGGAIQRIAHAHQRLALILMFEERPLCAGGDAVIGHAVVAHAEVRVDV